MAYKFQLGVARLSGSIIAEDGLNSNAAGLASAGAIAGVTTVSGSGKFQMGSFAVGGTDVSSTAAELNLVDGSGAGTIVNSKAVIYGSSGEVNATTLQIGGSSITSTAAEINLIDGNTARGTNALADGDGILVNDDGTMRMTNVVKMSEYALNKITGGDVSVNGGTGVATIAAAAVHHAMLSDDIISGQNELAHVDIADADDMMISDDGEVKKVGVDSLRDHFFGAVSGDATIADGGALTIAATSVENGMLAGSIANAKLANSSVTITAGDGLKTGGAVALGGSVTVDIDVSDFAGTGLSGDASENLNIDPDQTGIANILNTSLKVGRASNTEYIDFSNDNQIHFVNNDEIVARVISGSFVVHGNLHVSGTTTTVDSTTINISSSFVFEGPADDHETTLAVGTPTADITVMLPQYDTAETVHMAVLADATTNASSNVTAAEFALLDAASTRGTTAIATGDAFLHNDGGATMRQTQIDQIAAAFAGNGLQAAGIQMSLKLDTGVDAGSSFSVTNDGLALNNNVAGAGLALASGILSVDIDELTELTAAPHATQDEFMVSDNGTEKRVSMTNVANGAFALVSGDATIAAGGALTIAANAVHASMLNTDIVSGLTDIGAAIVSTDEMIVSDNGTIRRTDMSRVATFVGDNLAVNIQNVAAAGTLEVGVNYFSDMGSDGEDVVTLPASPSVGQSVKVKASSDCSDARFITINRAGSQTIDGATGIRLESPFAAVELVYVDDTSKLWRVF